MLTSMTLNDFEPPK